MKPEEIALYDLSNRPASFDFVSFLATAATHGSKHVRFVLNRGWKQKNYDDPEARFKSIVEPAVALWGMDYSVGEREGIEYNHLLVACLKTYQHFGRIAKMPYPCVAKDYVTITLRNSPNRSLERDSKNGEWRKFASRLNRKAIILRDYVEQPLDLEDRMKLYAGAHMNFFVINGPLTLCLHSEAPFLCMRTIGGAKSGSTSPEQITRLTGIAQGFQYPWQNTRQRLSYLDDTCENIEAEYAAMEAGQRMAA